MFSCQQQDYLEIACTYGYRLQVVLADGRDVSGEARDLRYDEQGQWCLLLQSAQQLEWLPLALCVSLHALTPNRYFTTLHVDVSRSDDEL